ncbi:hypothetical protein ACQBAR_03180 [Propionibacteriaceae bacterium Y1685]|uniref:hypothetical protein n=1 Tax=Microlunatus sp. Y1700 TaxID=3418487 RepID=UPI003B776C2D
MTTEQQGAVTPQAQNDAALATLRRFPTGIVVFLSLITVSAAAVLVSRLTASPVAKCGSKIMQPGDTCAMRGRRGRSLGDRNFEEAVVAAEKLLLGQTVAAAVVLLVAIAFLIMVVHRWRADVAAAPQLTGTHGLLGAAAFPTGVRTVVLFLTAAAVGGVSTLLVLYVFGFSLLGIGLAVVAVAIVAGIVWVGRPQGTTIIQVFTPGLAVLTRSQRTDVDWNNAQVRTRLGSPPAHSLSWVGRKGSVDIDDEVMFTNLRQRINEIQWPAVQQNFAAGQPIDFNAVRLEDNAVVNGRGRIPLAELHSVTVEVNKEKSAYLFSSAGQKIEVNTSDLGNPDLLFGLLRQHTRAAIVLH